MQMIQELFGKNNHGEYICQISYTYQLGDAANLLI